MRRRLSGALSLTLGVAGLALLYGHLLAPGRALVDRDVPFLHLPLLTDLARLARQGLPYWNPLIHGGQPLLTNPHYAAFYPPVWLVFLLPVHSAINVLAVAHVVWAFVGSWRLAIRWGCRSPAAGLAALAFVGGGAVISSPNLLNLFFGLAWLPWAMMWGDGLLHGQSFRAEIRTAIKLALALAAQLLAGGPVTPLLSLLAIACLTLEVLPRHPGRLGRLAAPGLLALGLAAVQLLPTLRHLAGSPRAGGLPIEQVTTFSTPPTRLAEWIWPRLHGEATLADQHLYFGYPENRLGVPLLLSIYCGSLILALAAGALFSWRVPRKRALAAMLMLGIFLALGRHNPVYTSLIVEIPPFHIIRYPEKFLLLATTALALLGALGWQELLRRRAAGGTLGLAIPVTLAALATAASGLLLTLPMASPELTVDLLTGPSAGTTVWIDEGSLTQQMPAPVLRARAAYLSREIAVSALVWAVTLLLLVAHSWRRISALGLTAMILACVTGEYWYYGRHHNRTVPATSLLELPVELRGLEPSVGRIYSDEVLFGNRVFVVPGPGSELPISVRAALQRVDPYMANLWGFGYALNEDTDRMMTRWARHALRAFHGRSGLFQQSWTDRVLRHLGAWNVAFIVRRRSPEAQLAEHRQTGAAPVPARLLHNRFLLPRYRIVSEVAFTPDLPTAVDRVSSLDFDLSHRDAVVLSAVGADTVVERYPSKVEVLSLIEAGSEITIDYRSSGESFLVAAITFDRDWRARVDGESAPVLLTALGQMGIRLPAGDHRLVLRHRNPAVPPAAALSLVLLVACAAALMSRRMPGRD